MVVAAAELIGRNGDIKIDVSRWWWNCWRKEVRRRFVQKDTSNRSGTAWCGEVRRGGEREHTGGMYGDLESCDSTIKLGEFCSWRGVVPTALYAPTTPPTAPFTLFLFTVPFHSYLRFDSPYLLYQPPPLRPPPPSPPSLAPLLDFRTPRNTRRKEDRRNVASRLSESCHFFVSER